MNILQIHNRLKNKAFFSRQDGVLKKIDVSAVLVLEANGRYLKLLGPGVQYLVPITIDKGIRALGPEKFCKVNRSYAVSVEHIEAIGRDVVTIAGVDVPLSKQYYGKLVSRVWVLDTGL